MLFAGDQGKILAGFRGESARLIPEKKMRDYRAAKNLPEPEPSTRDPSRGRRDSAWIAACKGGPPTYGDFLLAGPISDAFNLGAVSLRSGGRRLLFNSANAKITNVPAANRFLTREYREGWELSRDRA